MNDNRSKFIGSETAVSETLGYSFILGIVIVAVGVLVYIAFPIQLKIQDTAFVESQIQTITMLDGRLSSVAFGTSPMQDTSINLNGGSMRVKNDSVNRLIINVSNTTGAPEKIFDKELGTIEYTLNDNRIIYENGGLFRIYPDGESVMLSPPEFYYNGETLTIPIVRVENMAMAGGKGMLSVSATQGNPPKTIFPNLSTGYLRNPIYGKNITMTLRTDNYKAWKKYVDERTEASAGTNDITKEVFVKFNVEPSDYPHEITDPVEVYGLDVTNSTPVKKFQLNLTGVDSSLHMVFRAPANNSNDFVLDIQKRTGCAIMGISIEVRYNKDGANESWNGDGLCTIISDAADIDLLSQSIDLNYNNNQNSTTWVSEAYPNNKTFTKFAGSDGPVDLYTLIQHYMKLVSPDGTFSLYESYKKPNEWSGADFTNSTLALSYQIMPPTIQFMHIIEHSVNVSIS